MKTDKAPPAPVGGRSWLPGTLMAAPAVLIAAFVVIGGMATALAQILGLFP